MASKSNRKKGIVAASPAADVFKEADDTKDGAKTGLKKGGKVKGKKMDMGGKGAKKRFDRPGRKRGGAVGANTSPLSTAHNTAAPTGAAKSADTYGGTPK